jgi:hypothetical protein
VTGQWDDLLVVTQTFVEEDAKVILSLPVHVDMEDVIAWHYDTRGIFTVRSAYKVPRELKMHRNSRTAESSAQGEIAEETFWKGLWKFNCPGKATVFLWRLAHNSIVLRMELERKGMDLDTRCVMCGRFNEDDGHLFFQCKYVKRASQELNLEELRCLLQTKQSPREMLRCILGLKKDAQMKVINLLWQ